MPIGVGTAAAITAGSQLAASGINAAQTGNLNKKNRRFAEDQRLKQKETELEFWRMNNAYNHPSEQMARLQAAGLNPHLVYGTGTVAGNTSGALDAPQQAKWQGEPPKISGEGVRQGIDQYYNLQAIGAQTDNLREQNTLLKKEQMLKDMELLQKSVNLDKSKLGFEWDKQTFESRVFREMLNNINTQSTISDRNLRSSIYGDRYHSFEKPSFEPKLQGLAHSAAGAKARAELLELHSKMRSQGIEPGDKLYIRLAAMILNKFGFSLDDIGF